MFDIFRSIKKVAGFEKKTVQVENKEDDNGGLGEKINKISDLFSDTFNQIMGEFATIKEKSKDLYSANYNLGMKYLEEGNLKEAIFRFKITKKLFPKKYDAHYQLIICLVLNKNFNEAEKLMVELLEKVPEYKEKIDLIVGNSDDLKPIKTVQATN